MMSAVYLVTTQDYLAIIVFPGLRSVATGDMKSHTKGLIMQFQWCCNGVMEKDSNVEAIS